MLRVSYSMILPDAREPSMNRMVHVQFINKTPEGGGEAMTTVLVVEDNHRLRRLMASTLAGAGYFVKEAANGQEALDILEEQAVSLIVADLMMPVMDGLTLIESLRGANNPVPVLVITSKETLDDKRRSFQSGADDYMVKPIEMEEMLLRVEALLRRARIAQSHLLVVGETSLDQDSLTTARGRRVIVLPQKEFFLLQTLLAYPGKIFTRQALMDEIWGFDNDSDPRTVDVHIKRLREKYGDNEDFAIETVRGLGYRAVIK